MKRIIGGKRYDTDTATLVARWDNGMGAGDFQRCEEALYRTRAGAYFLVGSGGPMSRWARPCGSNGWSGGEGIRVLSEAEAYKWAEMRLSAEEVEAAFPGHITDA